LISFPSRWGSVIVGHSALATAAVGQGYGAHNGLAMSMHPITGKTLAVIHGRDVQKFRTSGTGYRSPPRRRTRKQTPPSQTTSSKPTVCESVKCWTRKRRLDGGFHYRDGGSAPELQRFWRFHGLFQGWLLTIMGARCLTKVSGSRRFLPSSRRRATRELGIVSVALCIVVVGVED